MDGWHFPLTAFPHSHSQSHSFTDSRGRPAHREQRFGILLKNAATCKVQPGEPGIGTRDRNQGSEPGIFLLLGYLLCLLSYSYAKHKGDSAPSLDWMKCFYLISSRPVQGEKNIWTLQNESCMVRQPMCGLLHSWTYSFIYGLIEPAWNQFPAGHSIALAHAHALTDTWYIQM